MVMNAASIEISGIFVPGALYVADKGQFPLPDAAIVAGAVVISVGNWMAVD
jgi:hypothetical protein